MCSLSGTLFAQVGKGLYLELGGAGFAYSINFDTRFFDTYDDNGLGMSLGLGLLPGRRSKYLFTPIHLNYLLGNDVHKIELGVGMSNALYFENGRRRHTGIYPSGTLMYRYHSPYKPLFFRAGLSPMIFKWQDDWGDDVLIYWFLLYPGVSIGWSF